MTNNFRNKKVLITGGLGFIGSNLAYKLVEEQAEVYIVDSLIPDYGGNLFNIEDIKDKVHINIADVRDKNSFEHLVKDKDYLFNLAGQVSHIDSMTDPYTDLEINCRSQLSILEACRKNNPDIKIVYAGTRQQYGKPLYLPVDENHLNQPTDVNGINKMAGEWYHILYNNIYGIRACSLRLTNVYGPRQLMKHNRQGFMSWFIRNAIDGKAIQIYGNGSQKRDLNYVDDVVDALLMAGESEKTNGQVYNLGNKEIISLLDIAKIIILLAQKGSYEFVHFPEDKKKIDIGDYYSNFDKIKNTLGWEPKTALLDGLIKTIDYYEKYKNHYWT